MKESPILFNGPMVRAILSGAKTQTRRAVKKQLPSWHSLTMEEDINGRELAIICGAPDLSGPHIGLSPIIGTVHCQHGQPGDRLWVRETWARDDEDGCRMYRADLGQDANADAWERGRIEGVPRYRWRPSIHMPRWASRITLEVNAVRVERLQDISEADTLAEGVTPKWEPGCSGRLMEAFKGFSFRPAASAYADLWEQINGPGSWDANPWVWVIEFKRV